MYYFKLSLAALLAATLWLAFVIISAFYGLWMTPVSPPGDNEDFFRKARELVEAVNPGNAALLLIENGQLAAEYYSSSKDSINRDTVFSTASMSKWITATAVMQLVQDGKIDLDAPISDYLTRWDLPVGEFDNREVTTRRLLSHTAGLADDLGFADYNAEETLPALEESLTNPRASSGAEVEIAVQIQPGTEFRYSGGSYLLLQLLIEEVTGMAFQDYMQLSIFDPLAMTRSTYDYIGDIENNAGSYDSNGQAAPLYQYAASAATGFAASGADLASFVLAHIPAANDVSILADATVQNMREPHGRLFGFDAWGLGTMLYAPTAKDDYVFGHDGANDPAINSTARINPDNGDAIIVLVTGHPSLATKIGSEWLLWQTGYPDFLDMDAIIASMYLPALLGVLLVLLAFSALGYRRHLHQRAIQ